MTVLAATDGPSQRAIADTLGIDRATVVALADDLEQRGLAIRARSPRDRRVSTLQLTAKGRRSLPRAHTLMDECDKSFLQALPPQHQAQLAATLRELLAASL